MCGDCALPHWGAQVRTRMTSPLEVTTLVGLKPESLAPWDAVFLTQTADSLPRFRTEASI